MSHVVGCMRRPSWSTPRGPCSSVPALVAWAHCVQDPGQVPRGLLGHQGAPATRLAAANCQAACDACEQCGPQLALTRPAVPPAPAVNASILSGPSLQMTATRVMVSQRIVLVKRGSPLSGEVGQVRSRRAAPRARLNHPDGTHTAFPPLLQHTHHHHRHLTNTCNTHAQAACLAHSMTHCPWRPSS